MNNESNAKYAFYYLLSLASLIFMGLAVGMVAFGIIDRSVTDALDYNSYSVDNQLKFGLSALLIAAPIYYWMSALIAKGLRKGELDRESGIRRYLTYFIILVSSLIILGFLLGLLNSFLSGELTTRFILKAVSVFIIAGGVFSYYLYDIKRDEVKAKRPTARVFFFASLALVLAAFISAWFFVESPKEARARRLDDLVISNMYSVESAINTFYSETGRLPQDIDELQSMNQLSLSENILLDPETKAAMEYQVIDEDTFTLCAVFRTDSFDQREGARPYIGVNDHSHSAGYDCIESDVWNKPMGEKTTLAQPAL